MQHPLQISRKVEYALRAMLYMASRPAGQTKSFREIALQVGVPKDFLAKILKRLVAERLLVSTRGAHGGYALARPASEISFLDVIEAVEGPISINVCTDRRSACNLSPTCSMFSIWKLGQERMLEVYRNARLDKLAMGGFTEPAQPAPQL